MAAHKKSRHRGAQGKANAYFLHHIASLGLKTIEEYRTWCHAHGFTAALNKDWNARRLERLAAQKAERAAAATLHVQRHIEALGLKTVPEYQEWCRTHGFGDGLHKSEQQRRRECLAVSDIAAREALSRSKQFVKRPHETIRAIFQGEIERSALQVPYLERIHDGFSSIGDQPRVREAFFRILRHVERHADLFDLNAVILQYGVQEGNTHIEGLLALARRHEQWIRPVEEWKRKSHNAHRQFQELARHLLAKYAVAGFMDSAWFQGAAPEATQRQDWFIHVGSGKNIRTAENLPIELTKRMAHLLMQAPSHYTIDQALRWTQVVGMGGSEELAEAVLRSRLGTSFAREEFWVGVVKFLVYNPLLDPEYVEPIVEYIHHQKFTPQEVRAPDGSVRLGDPPHPGFSMRGRHMEPLLELVDEWRGEREKEERLAVHSWDPCGVAGLTYEDASPHGDGIVRWTVRELTTGKELTAEGKAMSHCVSSYLQSCRQGKVSIWSVGVEDEDGKRRSILTACLKNDIRTVNQARGRHNALPLGGHRSAYYSALLRESYHILRVWANRENLRISNRI